MTKKQLFLKIGLAVGGAVVPGVAQVEQAVTQFKSGKDKREAVLGMANGAVQAIEFAASEDLVNDAEFALGLRMVNDGNVLMLRAINRIRPEEAEP